MIDKLQMPQELTIMTSVIELDVGVKMENPI